MEGRNEGCHENCVIVVVCLRLQIMVRFTGIYKYVQLPGVTEQFYCRREDKRSHFIICSYLLGVFFLVFNSAFQVLSAEVINQIQRR